MISMRKEMELRSSQQEMSVRLQQLIKEYKITRIMLLDACGVSYNTLYRLFQGCDLSCKSLIKIANGIEILEKRDCLI